MSPHFRYTMIVATALLAVAVSNRSYSDTTVTPYLSLGAYHRDCSLTDMLLCDSDNMGSDTPGIIDLGVRIETSTPKWYLLFADEIDIGWHHQSYVDRGFPFNERPEAQHDMYGIKLTWIMRKYSFSF